VYIKQGTVLVNAATTNSGPVVVYSSGTLGGTGGVSGPATVSSGGTVAPGASIGTLSLGGLTLRPGGAYQFEYNPGTASPVAGTDNDTVLATAGALDLSALSAANRFVVNLLPAFSATPPGSPVTYTAGTFSTAVFPAGVPGPDVTNLFTFAGAFAGTPTTAVNGAVLTFTFTLVPEPGAVLAACSVVAAAFTWRRRRCGKPRTS
jgi:hypothetical protein